jgi:hypothetical protein
MLMSRRTLRWIAVVAPLLQWGGFLIGLGAFVLWLFLLGKAR